MYRQKLFGDLRFYPRVQDCPHCRTCIARMTFVARQEHEPRPVEPKLCGAWEPPVKPQLAKRRASKRDVARVVEAFCRFQARCCSSIHPNCRASFSFHQVCGGPERLFSWAAYKTANWRDPNCMRRPACGKWPARFSVERECWAFCQIRP